MEEWATDTVEDMVKKESWKTARARVRDKEVEAREGQEKDMKRKRNKKMKYIGNPHRGRSFRYINFQQILAVN